MFATAVRIERDLGIPSISLNALAGHRSCPGGLRRATVHHAAGAAPVTGVFPAGVYLHLLETGIQAIQLSPYRADLPARRPIRLGTTAGFLACYFPRLPFRGRVSHQIQRHLLSIPARCAGDTTVRLMAHMVCKTVGIQLAAARSGTAQKYSNDPSPPLARAPTRSRR